MHADLIAVAYCSSICQCSPPKADSSGERLPDQYCSPVQLINGFEPQFIVRSTNGGNWSRSLIDTGATLTFISSEYARLHFADKIIKAVNPLSVRLGDSHKSPIIEYVEQTTRYNNRDATVRQWLMSLPPGIDNIYGLDWMRSMNIMIDPAHRRIILLDETPSDGTEGIVNNTSPQAAIIDHTDPSFLKQEKYLAFAASTSVKDVRSKLHSLEKTTVHSDCLVTSTNTLNKLIDQFNLGLLTIERVDAFTDAPAYTPVTLHAATVTNPVAGPNLNKSSIKRVATKLTVKDIKRARHERNMRKIFADISTLAQCDVSDWSGQQFTTSNCTPKSVHKSDTKGKIETEEETAWMFNCVFSPNNTVRLEGDNSQYEFNLGGDHNGLNSSPKASTEAINEFASWQASYFKDIGYNPACHTSATDMPPPPLYKGCPKDINKTDSTQEDWVNQLVTGQLGKFSCMDPVEKFDPLPSDEPLHIRLKPGATVPSMHRYRTPDHLLPEFKRYIDEMVQKGWLIPSDSEWAAPILIIKKAGTYEDGSSKGFRFVSDFRKLNSVVKPLQHHIPDIIEMWEQLKGAKYISVCDMKHGFWNAPISKASQKYVSVQTPWSTFSYTCVPMGLVNSSAYFQRWLTRKLRKHGILYEPTVVSSTPKSAVDGSIDLNARNGFKVGLEGDPNESTCSTHTARETNNQRAFQGFAVCYQDDICIFSNSAAEHRLHLKILFKVLSEEHIPLNIKKSHLFCKYVRYLGCVCGDGQLFLDPQKCDSIHNMIVAKDISSIRTFLGMTGFYRRWIKNYAEMARHLNALLKKGVDVKTAWSDKQDKAVTDLKAAITSYPVLRQPMVDRPWVIATDASNYQIGASIGQMVDGKMTVTAFCSRALRGAELNYPIQHKEALACIYALEKFNHYIMGCPHFTLRMWTDHQSLQFMHTQKDLAGRMARWAMKLSSYNCTIKFSRGVRT